VTGSEALALVDTLLRTSHFGQGLNDTQSKVFLDIWAGHSYQEIANRQEYELNYIKHIGAQLWKNIGHALNEKVSKSNIQTVLRQYQENHPHYPHTQDWGEAVDVSDFYGRQSDLQTLETWLLSARCRLIGIFGLGGVGKTSLSIKLARTVQSKFECIIWRSLRQAPTLQDLLKDIIPRLMGVEVAEISITALVKQLQQQHCLLVLDNVESILKGGDNRSGQYLVGYEDYGELLECICDQRHQSCLILTGREKPSGIALREGQQLPVRSLKLQGLPAIAAQQILVNQGLIATAKHYQDLVNYFSGNPLALKIAATTIQTRFDGDIRAYLVQDRTVFSTLWDLLEQQFQRLSPLQQQTMYWFAINRESITVAALQAELLPQPSPHKALEALESLRQQSLLESTAMGLTQQPVVMEFVTDRLIKAIEQEIINNDLNLFCTHALIEAQTQDYLRDAQMQMILSPLTERLITHFDSQAQLEQQLCKLLERLRQSTPAQTGYAGGNLLNLFCYLKTDLKGFNFSGLAIRQAYLLNAVLHEADFTGAHISQTVFAETFGGIVGVAFSPDGQRLATSDTKGDILIRDAQTGDQLLRLRGHKHWAWAVTFSPDGRYLASASDDYCVKLWDMETGQCMQTYEGHTNSVNAIAFCPNGQLIASSGEDATIRLWQAVPSTANPEVKTLVGHQGRVWAIAFSLDGQILASGGEDCTIRLWILSTGTCDVVWQAHDRWVRSLAFRPVGESTPQKYRQHLMSSSYDLTLKLWDVQTQDCIRAFSGHSQPVVAIAFSPDGESLASCGFDRTIKLWDVSSGQCLNTFFGHNSRIWDLAYHPSGQQIVSGGDDHATKFWDLRSGRCTRTLVGHTNVVLTLALSPDGQHLVSGHEDQTVRVWDRHNGAMVQTLREHTNRVWAVAFQPVMNHPLLASGSADYTIKFWDWQSGTCLKTLQGHNSWVWSVAFSPDGQQLASCSYDHTIKLWNVATGECLHTLQENASSVVSVAFSPCGQFLASSEFNGTIRVWKIEDGSCCQILNGHSHTTWSVSFSPTGAELLSASFDQTLKLWDIASGEIIRTFAHQGGAVQACFSADGEFILSGGLDRSLQLWQTATGECLQILTGHTDLIYALSLDTLALHEDSTPTLTAFSGGLDESIKVWDLRSQTCVATWKVPRPYEGMKIQDIQGVSEAQLMTLVALGAGA
jgi:WD40 repeat protein